MCSILMSSCSSRKQEDDYKSYGVSIKVKFRDETELAELSRGRQSGGEMSVTTAVYMLALQEMTTVPFRCVDEINQGLDERNERRVWDMILSAATEGQGSQYFYLAPKMPYNLNYRPGSPRSFPCMVANYPFAFNNQRGACSKFLELDLYGIRLLAKQYYEALDQ